MSSDEASLPNKQVSVSCKLPGYWKFMWMFWMQPEILQERLQNCGLDMKEHGAIHLWFVDHPARAFRRKYVTRIAAVLFIGSPTITLGFLRILSWVGIPINYTGVLVGVAFGISIGVFYF